MVHAQQSLPARPGEGKECDVVVVVPEPLHLAFGVEKSRIELTRSLKERVSPAQDNVRLVAIRNVMCLVDTGRKLAKGKSRRLCFCLP